MFTRHVVSDGLNSYCPN